MFAPSFGEAVGQVQGVAFTPSPAFINFHLKVNERKIDHFLADILSGIIQSRGMRILWRWSERKGEGERYVSGAAGSGSDGGADAVHRRLQTLVRLPISKPSGAEARMLLPHLDRDLR